MPLLSKKRKAVADGVFRAEVNEFLKREFVEDGKAEIGKDGKEAQAVGYAGVDLVHGAQHLEVRIRATRTREVVGQDFRRINELTSLIRQRFGFVEGSLICNASEERPRGLSAVAQAETLRYKLMNSVAPRKAALLIQKVTMESAAGCEIILSGKLRAQRAKHMKFRAGYMLKSGYGPQYFVRTAVRHVYLRQGVLGVKVSIMTKTDPKGLLGPARLLPDVVEIEDADKKKRPVEEHPRPRRDHD